MSEIQIPNLLPPPGPPARPPVYIRPHRGYTVLIFGILGVAALVTCCGIPSPIFGLIAWVLGANDLREMDEGRMDPFGRSNTSAGRICGIIATIGGFLVVLGIIAYVLLRYVVAENA